MVVVLLGVPRVFIYACTDLGSIWDRFGTDLGPKMTIFDAYVGLFLNKKRKKSYHITYNKTQHIRHIIKNATTHNISNITYNIYITYNVYDIAYNV